MIELAEFEPIYRCIAVDPPWTPALHADNPRRRTKDKGGPQKHYPTLSLEEIKAFKIPAADQCHLYLWVINQHIDWGYEVARHWGFEVEQMITWAKPGRGVGRFQCNTEHFLLCRKGGRVGNAFGKGAKYASACPGTWYNWPRGRHSEKPKEAYELMESMSSGPRLEMFSRTVRKGWDGWGLEYPDDRVSRNGELVDQGNPQNGAAHSPESVRPQQQTLFLHDD